LQQQEDLGFDPLGTEEAVDQKLAVLPLCDCTLCSTMETEQMGPAKFSGYKMVDMKKVTALTDHQNPKCNRSIHAFILDLRNWGMLTIVPLILEL
jgi:hypothetical protein